MDIPKAVRPRILLVDDDMAVAATLVDGLVAAGFQVVHAAHTSEALDKLDAGLSVDLCLVDLVMPRGEPDGLSFTRTVNHRDPPVPVILLTGWGRFHCRNAITRNEVVGKLCRSD